MILASFKVFNCIIFFLLKPLIFNMKKKVYGE